jgi:hypothetical protein
MLQTVTEVDGCGFLHFFRVPDRVGRPPVFIRPSPGA